MPNPTQTEFVATSSPVKPSAQSASVRPANPKNDRHEWPSLGSRSPLALARDLVAVLMGVVATLAWQSYGDNARHLIAFTASAPDQERFNGTPLDLDAVRRSIDGLATSFAINIATSREQITRSVDQLLASQEEMTRSVGQLVAGQEQMTRDFNSKLEVVERAILNKVSVPPPRPAPILAHNPIPRPTVVKPRVE
ncbi:MAG TPA: hypothetical protein VKC66_34010 [Xanthobacteraceae bacterium]|nr:hypothetical protein [Xanthobacteraceae bacterium]